MNVPRGQVWHSFVAASRNMPAPQTCTVVVVVVVVVVVEVVVEAHTTSDAGVPTDRTNSSLAHWL